MWVFGSRLGELRAGCEVDLLSFVFPVEGIRREKSRISSNLFSSFEHSHHLLVLQILLHTINVGIIIVHAVGQMISATFEMSRVFQLDLHAPARGVNY